VADKNMEFGVRGLLSRPKALRVKEIDAEILVHPRRDPGCVHGAHDLLRPFANDYEHALVMFDRHGSGREAQSPDVLRGEVRGRLAAAGWGNRAEVILLDPELEVWVFSPSPHVEGCLGWNQGRGSLRGWARKQNLWPDGQQKPGDPRGTLDRILRHLGRPRSSALYKCIARRVSLQRCSDPAFATLSGTLSRWFPADQS